MNAELAIVDDAETMRFLATEINPNGTKPARGTCQIYGMYTETQWLNLDIEDKEKF